MGAAICGCSGAGDLRHKLLKPMKNLPPGYTGNVIRAWLLIVLPAPLAEIIWEYVRELEIYFPPNGRPISARYMPIGNDARIFGLGQNVWNVPEISCTLMSRDDGLQCQFLIRNPRVLGHDAVTIWQGTLLKYKMIEQEYIAGNNVLTALYMNSTAFARPWRSIWEREILKNGALAGIEYMLPIIFDGMHDLWMLEMTRQW